MDEQELSAIEARARAATEQRNVNVGTRVDSFDPGPWCVEVPRDDVLRIVAEVNMLRAERRWIPVSEELPSHSGAVLVSCRHGVEVAHYMNCVDGDHMWLLSGGQTWAEGVTHWMRFQDKADELAGPE